jgi:mersacidin/lichenicidin family type 2 lantibiotic
MSQIDIIRAWKDAKYRRSLTPEQLASLPSNPAGKVELTDEQLGVSGGDGGGGILTTAINCTLYTFLNWAACGCPPPTTSPMCTLYTFQSWKACGC